MSKHKFYTSELFLSSASNEALALLCGHTDSHIKLLEEQLHVSIRNRGQHFLITGKKINVERTETILTTLLQHLLDTKTELSLEKIQAEIQNITREPVSEIPEEEPASYSFDGSAIKTRKTLIRPRTPNQRRYVQGILSHDINFATGPAGTGKTFLAVACAVAAFEQEHVERIVLVRPAVEAGEKLGFLPGDLAEKVDPYLRPLFDALYETMDIEKVDRLIEKKIIEIAPLAYMRGRTLNDAFIIMDEAQNTTKEQMKMFLTRIGFGSKAVITGDVTQIDLPKSVASGLAHAISILHEIKQIKFTFFDTCDVVRHPLVQSIIQAYDKLDSTIS